MYCDSDTTIFLVFNKLGGNRPNKRVRGYEPGYGAVNPNAPLAIGKVRIFRIVGPIAITGPQDNDKK